MNKRQLETGDSTKIRINCKRVNNRLEYFFEEKVTNKTLRSKISNKRVVKLLKFEKLHTLESKPKFAKIKEELIHSDDTEGTNVVQENKIDSLPQLNRDFSFGDLNDEPFPGFDTEKQLRNLQKEKSEKSMNLQNCQPTLPKSEIN